MSTLTPVNTEPTEWGLSVSVPHFLAAVFKNQTRNIPEQLMLPNTNTMLPPNLDTPVHENLTHYLPPDFGDTIISGSIIYPKYPLKDVFYVITHTRWVILNNFQEISISSPGKGTIIDRAQEIQELGANMFTEPLAPAAIPHTSILTSYLPTVTAILEKIENTQEQINPAFMFTSIPGDKHYPIQNWFTKHGKNIVRSTQFTTVLGTLTVSMSSTGGVISGYTKTNVSPQTITFFSATNTAIIKTLTELLPSNTL